MEHDTDFDIDELSDHTLSDVQNTLSDSSDSEEKSSPSSNNSIIDSSSSSSMADAIGNSVDRVLNDFESSDSDNDDDITDLADQNRLPKRPHRWYNLNAFTQAPLLRKDIFISNFHCSPRVFELFCDDYAEFFPIGR